MFLKFKLCYQPKHFIFLLCVALLFVVSQPLIWAQKSSKSVDFKTFKVVLDAGHGGKDPGNRGNGYYEKSIALNIVLEIGKWLQNEDDIEVIFTRKKDVFVDLNVRASIANKANADLFISVHCDAFSPKPQVNGAGTFVLGLHENDRNFQIAQKENSVIFLEDNYEQKYDGFDPNNPESVIGLVLMQEEYLDQSIDAASHIQEQFVNALGRNDRTVKQAGFLVLRNTYMPSVLIETGFLTNQKEGAYLNSTKGQKEMAKTISKAIIAYKNRIQGKISKPDTRVFDAPNTVDSVADLDQPLFAVQIAASSKIISTTPNNFKGVEGVYRKEFGTLQRYYVGATHVLDDIKLLHENLQKLGFTNSFIVAQYRGSYITLSEALSLQKK